MGIGNLGNSGHREFKKLLAKGIYKAQELCESRGGRPGLPVPNKPYGLCGRNQCQREFKELGIGSSENSGEFREQWG